MSDSLFQLEAPYELAGDQPQAVEALSRGYFDEGKEQQVLMGVTGSGKTFLMAQMIARCNRPALVISHNKTLAAQLYSELRQFFPHNAVEYFVSYYDYYQPEAYIPQRDIYIEKDASINADIDRLRLASTSSLMARQDVIIVASVSCIYGLGSPEQYREKTVSVRVGAEIERDTMLRKLVDIQYSRNDFAPDRATFRARGDVVEVLPAYDEVGYRIEFFGDEVERIEEFHRMTGEIIKEIQHVTIYPAKHFVINDESRDRAIATIQTELTSRLAELDRENKPLEAHRLGTRTRYDLELLREVGYCPGIENYSRHFTGLAPDERPFCLLDYYPDDFLCVIDESHVTIPQIGGMYAGDRSRKETLVSHGFRLPSALDNRPMKFPEWEEKLRRVLMVSATPGPYELEKTQGEVVEVVNRPTGLLDPEVHIHPATGQVQDLIGEVRTTLADGDRVIVTTLTKRMSEDLSDYFQEASIKTRYLHSEVQTLERVEILQDLRRGKYDVVVGVNLLREGLDLPEVALVAIMDADKEGFLRSTTSLIQTIGRAARNLRSRVILYADRITDSMQRAIDETARRRTIQRAYNEAHGIEPRSIIKDLAATVDEEVKARDVERSVIGEELESYERSELANRLEKEMLEAATNLEFERAAELRDRIESLKSGDKNEPGPDLP